MASSKIYDIAFRLNGKLNNSYNSTFAKAEAIAERATRGIRNTILSLGSMVISTAAIKDFVDTYKEYQQEMHTVAATSGIDVNSEDYERLNKAALAAGKATTKTATESAQALNYMALAGWSVEDSVKGLMPILRLSEATHADLATTSDLVTDSMAAMGLGVEDMTKYLDMAEMANNKSNQTALQMMEAIIKTGGIAKTVGIDMYDLGTALGILANNGVKAEEAGTAMNSMLVRISSNDTAITAMDALGISAYDAQGKFKKLEDIFIDINRATEGMVDEDRMAYLTAISGTRYASKMNYLLESVKKGADGTASSWNKLNGELWESSGALDRAVATQNSSLEARLKLLQSAWDDLKINVVSQAEPIMSEWVSKLANVLPDITEKTIQFIHKAGKYTGELWDKGKGLFNWASKNKDTLVTIFAGIGSAIATYKVVSGLMGVGSGFAAIGAVILAHPVVAALVAGGAAFGAIAYNVYKANKRLAEANLAEKFGDIALSLEDVKKIADGLFTGRGFYAIEEAADALELAAQYFEDFERAGRELDKYNFKVSLGIELTEGDITEYKSGIEDFISNAQRFIDQQQYAVHIAVSEFVASDSDIAAQVNEFYANKNQQVAELGTKLSDAVNKAFEDNVLTIDEAKVIEKYQNEMESIMNKLNQAEMAGKMGALQSKWSGEDLTAESYQQLISEGQSIVEEYAVNSQQALSSALAVQKLMLDEGSITQQQYENNIKELNKGYYNDIGYAQGELQAFINNTLMNAYGNDMIAAMNTANEKVKPIIEQLGDAEGLQYAAGKGNHRSVEPIVRALITDIRHLSLGVDKETKNAFKELYSRDNLEDLIDEAEKFKKAGVAIPENIMEGIKMQISSGVIAGNTNALMMYVYSQLYGYEELIGEDMSNIGKSITNRIADGCESGAPEAAARMQSAVGGMIDTLQYYLNKNPLIVKYNNPLPEGVQGPVQGTIVGVKGFANGTNYTPDTFIAGERGPELITDSRGYRVYDALATGKIYDSAARLWELNESSIESRNVPVRGRINTESTGSTAEYNFTFTMPSITINGDVSDDTANRLKAMLEQYKAEVERSVIQQLRSEEDRRRRVSNE